MLTRVENPPNPWHSTHQEWVGPPPPARLEVFEEKAKSIVVENRSPDVGFGFSINPYRGCFHGCTYCLDGETPVLMAMRFEAMRVLADAGIPVGVAVAPLIPGLNDSQVTAILERARDCGARSASARGGEGRFHPALAAFLPGALEARAECAQGDARRGLVHAAVRHAHAWPGASLGCARRPLRDHLPAARAERAPHGSGAYDLPPSLRTALVAGRYAVKMPGGASRCPPLAPVATTSADNCPQPIPSRLPAL